MRGARCRPARLPTQRTAAGPSLLAIVSCAARGAVCLRWWALRGASAARPGVGASLCWGRGCRRLAAPLSPGRVSLRTSSYDAPVPHGGWPGLRSFCSGVLGRLPLRRCPLHGNRSVPSPSLLLQLLHLRCEEERPFHCTGTESPRCVWQSFALRVSIWLWCCRPPILPSLWDLSLLSTEE